MPVTTVTGTRESKAKVPKGRQNRIGIARPRGTCYWIEDLSGCFFNQKAIAINKRFPAKVHLASQRLDDGCAHQCVFCSRAQEPRRFCRGHSSLSTKATDFATPDHEQFDIILAMDAEPSMAVCRSETSFGMTRDTLEACVVELFRPDQREKSNNPSLCSSLIL